MVVVVCTDTQYTLYNINAVTERVANTMTNPCNKSGIHTSVGVPSPEPTSPEPGGKGGDGENGGEGGGRVNGREGDASLILLILLLVEILAIVLVNRM
jgi:hypothetical protein